MIAAATEHTQTRITDLEELRDALALVEPHDFSRYTKLLELLRSSEYNWNPKTVDDRIVIFTERIETMKFLAKQLREDLHMSDKQVVEISGGMTDMEQQRVVEEFGRTEAPVRILVASDVASEGLNLHYLSHRLIHFDIPWSLMVFQQRNGRIDRYGQEKRPDIRYMTVSKKLEKAIDKVRNKLGADTAEELNNNICEVIKLMSRDQFKLGYGLGLEYLADLSGLPGNTISERVKAELDMSKNE